MKKILLSALGVLFALPGLGHDFAYEYEGQTLYYDILDEEAKTCRIIQKLEHHEDYDEYVNYDLYGNLVIPDFAKNEDTEYSVVSLSEYVFDHCESLTSVTLGNSLVSIETGAFQDCKSLISVTFGTSLTEIGSAAFNLCSSLKSGLIRKCPWRLSRKSCLPGT